VEKKTQKKTSGRGSLIALPGLAIGLGAMSSWPLTSAPWPFFLHTLFFIVTLAVFFLLLPRRLGLPLQILAAMALGIAAGWAAAALGDKSLITDYLGIFGKLFILLLKVVIIPLIFVSVLCGVAGIGDVRKLGALGVKTIGYYFITTSIAVIIGLTLVNTIGPGKGREQLKEEFLTEESGAAEVSYGMIIQQKVLPAIIQNPIMAGESPIVIIFMALLLGAALAALGEEGKAALHVFRSLDKAFIMIVMWVMKLAPIGVFALMARAISDLGLSYMLTLAKYCFTVLGGLSLHFIVLTCVLCPLFGRVSPLRFLRGMLPAFGVSFSTSSSSATLPVTIRCVSKRIGANENISNFMLPVGATINMDGTALYLSVASLFIAQVYGMQLSLQSQFLVFLTAVFASVGTAGIPGASIGLMSIILASAGVPVEGIGIVIGVDRILDMSRTVVNITGDSVGAVVVSRSEGHDIVPDPAADTL
jgi:Na+/H+-dicarboxylate symporter